MFRHLSTKVHHLSTPSNALAPLAPQRGRLDGAPITPWTAPLTRSPVDGTRRLRGAGEMAWMQMFHEKPLFKNNSCMFQFQFDLILQKK